MNGKSKVRGGNKMLQKTGKEFNYGAESYNPYDLPIAGLRLGEIPQLREPRLIYLADRC